METPISTPSPAIFLNQELNKPGVYEDLITTIKPIHDPKLPKTGFKYNAKHPTYPSWGRTYGGVTMTQAIACALLSLDDPTKYYVSQLQLTFLRGGEMGRDFQYHVQLIKQSRSFTTYRIDAYQLDQIDINNNEKINGNENINKNDQNHLVDNYIWDQSKLVITSIISFNSPSEPNRFRHTFSPYNIDFTSLPHPDTIPLMTHEYYNMSKDSAIQDPVRKKLIHGASKSIPIVTKAIERDNLITKYHSGLNIPRKPRQLLYVRMPSPPDVLFNVDDKLRSKFAPKNQNYNNNTNNNNNNNNNNAQLNAVNDKLVSLEQHLNLLALTYSSDYNMVPTVLRPHAGVDPFPLNFLFSSLTHNITFLTPNIDIHNDWLIFDCSAPFYDNSRAQLVGTFYTRDGEAVAYVTQECLARDVVVVNDGDMINKFPNPFNFGAKQALEVRKRNGGRNIGAFGIDLDKQKQLREMNKFGQARL